MAYCITKSYGMERIKARAPEWLAAMWAGRDAAPKCGVSTKSGGACSKTRMRGSDRCSLHLHAAQRDIVDVQRAKRAEKMARSTNKQRREAGERALAVIARRKLHRAWKLDANLPGSTLVLGEGDEERVLSWLEVEHGIVLGTTEHDGGWPLSYRCIDRLRWAAALRLTGRITDESARLRVKAALRDDLAWRRRFHGVAP